MPWIALAAAAVYSGVKSSQASSKAQEAIDNAAKASQVDVNKLDEQTRRIARQNAYDSAELERELTPEVPQIRTTANRAVLKQISNDDLAPIQKAVESSLGTAYNTPLMQAGIAKAYSNLQLGGKLGADQQNLVTRNALAKAGSVGGGNLGLGRDLTARDLGLSSLELENKRLQDAGAFGQKQLEFQQADENAFNTRVGLVQSLNAQRFGNAFGAAQYGQSIEQPMVGLDPGAVANVVTGNANNAGAAYANKANIYGNQSNAWLSLAGSFASGAAKGYGGGK